MRAVYASARQQGLTDEMLAAIPTYHHSSLFTPREKVALRFAEVMAPNSELGRLRDDIPGVRIEGESLRRFPVNTYVVFYQSLGDGVRILRVLHSAHGLSALF